MITLISYDLNGHERPSSYEAVRAVIERDAREWVRPLYSQWLVDSDRSPRGWTNALGGVIDNNDNLLVVQVVNHSYFGRANMRVWEWLTARGLSPAG
jgi:hypothetical protein